MTSTTKKSTRKLPSEIGKYSLEDARYVYRLALIGAGSVFAVFLLFFLSRDLANLSEKKAGTSPEHLVNILSNTWFLSVVALAVTAFALYVYRSEWQKVVAYVGGIVVILVIWGLYKNGLLHGNVLYTLYVVAGGTYLVMRKVLDPEETKYFRRFFLLAAFGVLGLSHILMWEDLKTTFAEIRSSLTASNSPVPRVATTPECPGGAEPIPLNTNWVNINPERKCRIIARVKSGQVIFRGSGGETRPIGPDGGHWEDMIYYEVRGVTGADEVLIGRCPKNTAHIKNIGWDCMPLNS